MALEHKWKNVCQNLDRYKTRRDFVAAIEPLVEKGTDLSPPTSPAQICANQQQIAEARLARLRKAQMAILGECASPVSIDQESLEQVDPAEFVSFFDKGKVYCDNASRLSRYFDNSRLNYLTRAPISPATRKMIRERAQNVAATFEPAESLVAKIDRQILAELYRRVFGTERYLGAFVEMDTTLTARYLAESESVGAIDKEEAEIIARFDPPTSKKILWLTFMEKNTTPEFRDNFLLVLADLNRRKQTAQIRAQIDHVFDTTRSQFALKLAYLKVPQLWRLAQFFESKGVFSPQQTRTVTAVKNPHLARIALLDMVQNAKDLTDTEKELANLTQYVGALVDKFFDLNFYDTSIVADINPEYMTLPQVQF